MDRLPRRGLRRGFGNLEQLVLGASRALEERSVRAREANDGEWMRSLQEEFARGGGSLAEHELFAHRVRTLGECAAAPVSVISSPTKSKVQSPKFYNDTLDLGINLPTVPQPQGG